MYTCDVKVDYRKSTLDMLQESFGLERVEWDGILAHACRHPHKLEGVVKTTILVMGLDELKEYARVNGWREEEVPWATLPEMAALRAQCAHLLLAISGQYGGSFASKVLVHEKDVLTIHRYSGDGSVVLTMHGPAYLEDALFAIVPARHGTKS